MDTTTSKARLRHLKASADRTKMVRLRHAAIRETKIAMDTTANLILWTNGGISYYLKSWRIMRDD
jgi:hypothetical protein